MKLRELIRHLVAHGCPLKREGGSHSIYWSPRQTACSNNFDLVAFIGHNGLMDFNLEVPKKSEGNDTEVVILCCVSERYFGDRLRALGCRPILMTQQLMYPGSFI